MPSLTGEAAPRNAAHGCWGPPICTARGGHVPQQAQGSGRRKAFAWFMCQARPSKVNRFCRGSQRRGKTAADPESRGGRGEGIRGRAKSSANKPRCSLADERAAPGKGAPVPRHKSGAAQTKPRTPRWHGQEKNHPLLVPNNSPGPPNTLPSSPTGAAHSGGSVAMELREMQAPGTRCKPCPGFGSHQAAATHGRHLQPLFHPPSLDKTPWTPSIMHGCPGREKGRLSRKETSGDKDRGSLTAR